MSYLPFWLGGVVLATFPVLHWLALRRALAVSGRYTALVDRARHVAPADSLVGDVSEADAIAALRALTAETFGASSVEAAEPIPDAGRRLALRAPDPPIVHAVFLVGLIAGGAISAALGHLPSPGLSLRGELFARYFGGSHAAALAVLFAGGLLVGAGTRMAGGCTSGHGLCGVSQLQKGSLVSTAAFFGAGVVVSLVIRSFG